MKKLFKVFIFGLLVLMETICFSQTLKQDVERVDLLISDTISISGFFQKKSCVLANKDTVNYYNNRSNIDLVKVEVRLYNPRHKVNLETKHWTYYLEKGNLILASYFQTSAGDENVGIYESFYFKDRLTYSQSGSELVTVKPKEILQQVDLYMKTAETEGCM